MATAKMPLYLVLDEVDDDDDREATLHCPFWENIMLFMITSILKSYYSILSQNVSDRWMATAKNALNIIINEVDVD